MEGIVYAIVGLSLAIVGVITAFLVYHCCLNRGARGGYDEISEHEARAQTSWVGYNPTDVGEVRDHGMIPGPTKQQLEYEGKVTAERLRRCARGAGNYLRSAVHAVQMKHELPFIGTRSSKSHFIVNDTLVDKEYKGHFGVLLAQTSRADFDTSHRLQFEWANLRHKKRIAAFLMGLEHPYILKTLRADFGAENKSNASFFTLRFAAPGGSVRDKLYERVIKKHGLTCFSPASEKYPRPEKAAVLAGTPIQTTDVRRYGRQVLDALIYLQDVGLPYHVHTGNVILIDDQALLTDYDNCFFGFWGRMHDKVAALRGVNPDVGFFLAFLYEMVTAKEIPTPIEGELVVMLPNKLTRRMDFENLFEDMLTKKGMTLRDVRASTLFVNVQVRTAKFFDASIVETTKISKMLKKSTEYYQEGMRVGGSRRRISSMQRSTSRSNSVASDAGLPIQKRGNISRRGSSYSGQGSEISAAHSARSFKEPILLLDDDSVFANAEPVNAADYSILDV
jgi:hypothetical protein